MQKVNEAPTQTESELIRSIVAGEIALFEVLIRRYNGVLYKIARCYGFNHQDAEDLMQETHIAAYSNLAGFQEKASYKTWIAKIMMHKCIYKLSYGYFKKEHSYNEWEENETPIYPQTNMATDKIVLNKELSRVLEKSLQKLPLTYRTVFILREIEGFNVNETAELMNSTPINVKVRLSRAKALLQKEIERFYSSAHLFEFNEVYCTAMVNQVMKALSKTTQ